MLNEDQKYIIKAVCSVQFKSLEQILLEPDLEEDYNLILESHGCDRKDFDKTLIKTRLKFQEVYDDPEKLFELDNLDMGVFRFILNHIKDKYIYKFPKSLNNLLNRILIYQMMGNIENQN